MHIKIICTDIDGTLLNKERAVSEKTAFEISRIKGHIPVILVSSRMPKAMRHIQVTLGIEHFPIIAYNGGLVLLYDGKEAAARVFLSVSIAPEISGIIYQRVRQTNIHTSLYLNDDWYVEHLDYWAEREINNTRVRPLVTDFEQLIQTWESQSLGPHKIMCMGPEDEIHALEQFLQAACGEQLNIYRSKPTYLELSSKFVSKATAIEKLLTEHMGFQMNEAVAFGDNYNDIEMLQAVGLGIAMANGNEALKQMADEMTLSNVEDGVAVAIEKLFE